MTTPASDIPSTAIKNWEFDAAGLMKTRHSIINDLTPGLSAPGL
jgi:nuclear transport factor 2 (NTF2) superfamily protein